jgi:hypothetical protein
MVFFNSSISTWFFLFKKSLYSVFNKLLLYFPLKSLNMDSFILWTYLQYIHTLLNDGVIFCEIALDNFARVNIMECIYTSLEGIDYYSPT